MNRHIANAALLGWSLVAVAVGQPAFAVTVSETERTVESENLLLTWSEVDQEALVSVQWDADGDPASAPNIAGSSDVGSCTTALAPEYWGNSWEGGAPQAGEEIIVGLGTVTPSGETAWRAAFGEHGAGIHSQSTNCNSALNAAELPVRTRYRFYDHGPRRNVIRIDRTFLIDEDPFTDAIRPYIPRLSRALGYEQVLYPATGGTPASINVTACPFGCVRSNWASATNWYAINNATTGEGVIALRAPNGYAAALWVDWDAESFSNATSFRLGVPQGGFTDVVVERQVLCFYDRSIWPEEDRAALKLPAGCSID